MEDKDDIPDPSFRPRKPMAVLSNKKSVIHNFWRSTKNIGRLLDNSPDSIFVSRVDNFVFVEVNMRAIKNYGYSLEEFMEMNIFDTEVEKPLETEVRKLYDNMRFSNF